MYSMRSFLICAAALIAVCAIRGLATEIPGEGEEPADPPLLVSVPFEVANGEQMWRASFWRATRPVTDIGGKPARTDDVMIEGFKRVKGFVSENYTRQGDKRQLIFRLSAAEARREGHTIQLTELKLTYYLSAGAEITSALTTQAGDDPKAARKKESAPPLETPANGGAADPANPAEGAKGEKANPLPPMLRRGRLVITALTGAYDSENAEGQAGGGVTIEIFSEDPADLAQRKEPSKPLGVLSCERLRWRTWREPAIGASEIAVYVLPDSPHEPAPLVKGVFVSQSPEGEEARMELQARGMIFENSVLDHPRPVKVGDQIVGQSSVRRRSVLFHSAIKMLTTGSLDKLLVPFQEVPAAVKGEGEAVPETEPAAPAPATRTMVTCSGPALMNLATLPRSIQVSNPGQELGWARRFEFLNGVQMSTYPMKPSDGGDGAAGTQAYMRCGHLCIQYPGGPATSMYPEYAEAAGTVLITGTKAVSPNTEKPEPRRPFRIDCWRVSYDGATDSIMLEGTPGAQPLTIEDELGELATQMFSYSRKTQALLMPDRGPKHLYMRPAAMKALSESQAAGKPADGGKGPPNKNPGGEKPPKNPKSPKTVANPKEPKKPDGPPADPSKVMDLAGSGELKIKWFGPGTRKILRVPTEDNKTPVEKEVLSLQNDVDIEQSSGVRLMGQMIRVQRDKSTGQVESVEGRGDVRVSMGGMNVKGEVLTMRLNYDDKGTLLSNKILISGKDGRANAFLWQGPRAIRGKRFEIDVISRTFKAVGGVVARVALPEPKDKPVSDTAQGATGLMPGISLSPGGQLNLQCDGDLVFDGATATLVVRKNVLMYQEGMQVVCDGLALRLDQPDPNAPKDPKAPPAEEQGMFSGNVKTIECRGGVEITTPTQVVHSARVFYDMQKEFGFMEAERSDQDVRVYMVQPGGGTKLLTVRHRVDLNMATGEFDPSGVMLFRPYSELVPLPRQQTPQK